MVATFNRLGELSGPEAIDFAHGYPSFDRPQWLSELWRRAVLEPEYEEAPYGSLGLRVAISRVLSQEVGLAYDPAREITIGGSASELLTAAVLAASASGRHIVIVEPAFPVYVEAAALARAPVYRIRCDPFTGEFEPTDARTAFRHGPCLLILNSPNNPTGAVYDEAILVALARLAESYDVLVLSDEVFSSFVRSRKRLFSIAACENLRDRAWVVGDTGKRFPVGGFRLGWIAASPAMTALVRTAQQVMTFRTPSNLARFFADALLQAAGNEYYTSVMRTIEDNAAIACDLIQQCGGTPNVPQGGYFLLAQDGRAPVPLHEALASKGILALPGEAFFSQLAPRPPFCRLTLARPTALFEHALERVLGS